MSRGGRAPKARAHPVFSPDCLIPQMVIESREQRRVFKLCARWEGAMKLKVIVHEAEEGGYWAEVPSIPGCATQGETIDELKQNLREAIEGCLAVDLAKIPTTDKDQVLEIAV
jgi:predicted RNase H-like HicB family nuclease